MNVNVSGQSSSAHRRTRIRVHLYRVAYKKQATTFRRLILTEVYNSFTATLNSILQQTDRVTDHYATFHCTKAHVVKPTPMLT